MCQDSVDNVLNLNTPVRRIGNDPDRTTAAAANLNVYADGRPDKTRLSRCAQVIPDEAGQALAACCSSAERTSALEIGLTPFPRLAAVSSPRHR